MNIIGSRIRNAREKKCLTQAALAMLMGVTVQTVWRWENGVRIPDVPTLQRIAKELEITMAYLTGDTDQSNKSTVIPKAVINSSEDDFDGLVVASPETMAVDDYEILPSDSLEEIKRKHIEWLRRIQDSNREKTQESVDKAKESVPCPGAAKEAAASSASRDKKQPDELIPLLIQVRKQMIAEYPQMDADDKEIVAVLLIRINAIAQKLER